MPKIDNDETKTTAQPFAIIASMRAGGTFLAHCLSSHPDIFCDRAESLHRHSVWRQQMPDIAPGALLSALLHREGYQASGCRLVYNQSWQPEVMGVLRREMPLVIHLTRDNVLRQACSLVVNRMIRICELDYYPVHTFTPESERGLPSYTVHPGDILDACREIADADLDAATRMHKVGFTVLPMTYAEITGGEGETRALIDSDAGARVCEFLGVVPMAMRTRLERVHAHGLAQMFANWDDIADSVAGSEFARWLDEEDRWQVHRYTQQ
jgi:hypothetical protein